LSIYRIYLLLLRSKNLRFCKHYLQSFTRICNFCSIFCFFSF